MDAAERRGRFDRAVVFFDEGAFYEAHEDWEEIWHESEGAERLWVQGLIQYAAAFVHWARGFHARGFARLMVQATEKVAGYDGPTHGVDWPALAERLAPWIAHGRAVEDGATLRDPALGEPPTIPRTPGYEPAPWPPDPEDAETD